MRQTAQIKLHQHNSVINTDKTYTYPRIRLRLGPSRVNYVSVAHCYTEILNQNMLLKCNFRALVPL